MEEAGHFKKCLLFQVSNVLKFILFENLIYPAISSHPLTLSLNHLFPKLSLSLIIFFLGTAPNIAMIRMQW